MAGLTYKQCRAVGDLMLEFGYRDIVLKERHPSGDRWVMGRIMLDGLQFVLTVNDPETIDTLRAALEHFKDENHRVGLFHHVFPGDGTDDDGTDDDHA